MFSGLSKYSLILLAIISPMSGIFTKSSKFAFIKSSKVLKFWARILPVLAPTWGIPKANNNFSNELDLEFSIASSKL